MQIRHYDGNGEHLTKGNKWNVSEAENGAERAENRMSGNGAVSGDHRKRWSVSGGAERERSGERRSMKCLER